MDDTSRRYRRMAQAMKQPRPEDWDGTGIEPDWEAIIEARRQDPDPDFHNSNFYDITSKR